MPVVGVPGGTFQTFTEVGAKEDVSDVITNISPRRTPFQSGIGNEKVTQKLYQWQEDSLRAVESDPAVEGDDVSFRTVMPTVMRMNLTQIFRDAVSISGTVQATLAYGRSRELAYQMAKTAAALKRDLEHALVGTSQTQVPGDAATTGRTFDGYQAQIDATVKVDSGTALSEDNLVKAIGQIYENGAEPTRIMVTPSNSITLAAFAQAAGRFRQIPNSGEPSQAIVNAVNLYVSPFGQQRVEIDRFLRPGNTLVFEPGMWSLTTLRPWTRENIAKTGDSFKQMLVGEFGLKHKNFKASALITDTATEIISDPNLNGGLSPGAASATLNPANTVKVAAKKLT